MGIFAQIKDRVGNRLRLDSTFGAARTSYSPLEYQSFTRGGGHYSLGTTISPATSTGAGVLFSMRNPGPNVMVLQRIRVGAVVGTVITTAVVVGLAAQSGRQFTVPHSTGGTILDAGRGGTGIVQQSAKCRSSMAPTSAQANASAGAVLTGATVTLDPLGFAYMALPLQAAAGTGVPMDVMYEAIGNHQYPMVYDPSEGFVISNLFTTPATGSITIFIAVEWAEVPSF